MTAHGRDKVLAAAKEAGIHRRSTPIGTTEMFCWEADIESLYAIAFEDGRQSVDTPVALAEAYRCVEEAGRQAEREEIATSLTPYYKPNKTEVELMADAIAFRLVEAIRARGDTK